MSATLSRRFARVTGFPPIRYAPVDIHSELNRLTSNRWNEFEDLPEHYQHMILEAEANRQRAVEAERRGDPSVLKRMMAEALAAAQRDLAAARRAQRPARPRGSAHSPALAEPVKV